MSKALEVAISQLGVKENPPNSNNVKYNDWIYGKPTSGSSFPWCAAFVSWCYNEAKQPLGRIDLTNGFVGCPYAVKNVDKWGRIVTIPQAGDIVFYDWQGDGKFDHTGIFEKDLGKGLFSAIEGNTSLKNNSNGGEVMRRADRKYKNVIFIRPNVIA